MHSSSARRPCRPETLRRWQMDLSLLDHKGVMFQAMSTAMMRSEDSIQTRARLDKIKLAKLR